MFANWWTGVEDSVVFTSPLRKKTRGLLQSRVSWIVTLFIDLTAVAPQALPVLPASGLPSPGGTRLIRRVTSSCTS